jgi:outer membrane cobalamin receptor
LLNAGAEYQINETFGVYAKLLNILGQDYEIWNGYTERPFQMFGGLTVKF